MSDQQRGNENTKDHDHEHEAGQAREGQHSAHQEDLRCVACGHPIEQDDLVCPNCGISLVAG